MSAYPRTLLATITTAWPPGSSMLMTWRVDSVVDAAPGGQLEAAIGAANPSAVLPAAQREQAAEGHGALAN